MAVLAYLAYRYHWQGFWKGAGQPFATVFGGMAALAAGSLAFYNGERQRASEAEKWEIDRATEESKREDAKAEADRQHRRELARDLRARFTTATSQLADPQATIRRSGAYAMAALADDWKISFDDDTERQVCIDVLCGYLTTANPTFCDQEDSAGDAYPGADAAVRTTILQLLSRHRGTTEPRTSWENATYDLQMADLRSLRMTGLNLARADLTGAFLTDSDFSGPRNGPGAVLNGAKLSNANLTRTRLNRAQLQDVNLTGADLSHTNLDRSNLTGAELFRANMYRASLNRATLNDASLTEANLSRADLTRCNLQDARLAEATLIGARLGDANLHGANIRGADFAEAVFTTELKFPDDPNHLLEALHPDKALNLHLADFNDSQRQACAALIDRAERAAEGSDAAEP